MNITLPRRVLRVIDEASKRSGETRLGYIVRAGLVEEQARTLAPYRTRSPSTQAFCEQKKECSPCRGDEPIVSINAASGVDAEWARI